MRGVSRGLRPTRPAWTRRRSDRRSMAGYARPSDIRRSVQPRRLEQLGAIGRGHGDVEGDALVMHREWHVHAGVAERPELAVEFALARHLVAIDAEDDVAGLQFGAGGGAVVRDADHHDAIVDLGGVEAEPGPGRLVDAAE